MNSAKAPVQNEARTARGARARLKILAAARQVLVEEGFAGLSLRNVARRAGLALGNVSHYFPVLEQLLSGLVDDIVQDYARRLGAGPPQSGQAALTELDKIVGALVDDLNNPETAALFIEIWSIARHNAAASAMMTALYDQERLLLERVIAAISPAMPDDIRARRATLIAMQIEGLMLVLGPGRPPRHWHRGLREDVVLSARFLATAPWPDGTPHADPGGRHTRVAPSRQRKKTSPPSNDRK